MAAWRGITFAGGTWSPETVVYPEYLLRIASRIQRVGHGGTILIVPDDESASSEWIKNVRIKYPCSENSMWELIRTALRTYDESAIGTGLDDHTIAAAESHIPELLDRIATLASVDGAVLITDRFRLYGFGVEVTTHAAVDHVQRADGSTVAIEAYGTRHRAAFRFCAAHPGSIAIVCSQDGGARCVRFANGNVYIYG